MKRTLTLAMVIACGAAFAGEAPEMNMVGVTIGLPLPVALQGRGHDMGKFTWTTVPVLSQSLSAHLHQVNVFSDSKTKVVAGFRSDRTMPNITECQRVAQEVDAVLHKAYPEPYKNESWQYQGKNYKHKAMGGSVIAGVRCEAKAPFSELIVEVTDLKLEESLFR